MTTDDLIIETPDGTISVELWIRHKNFATQSTLLQELSTGHGDGRSVADIDKARKQSKMIRLAVVLVVLVGAVVYGLTR